MAEQVQGGRLAAQAIAAEGVDTIFTLCGGHVMPIYEGCRLEGMRVIDVRHEQAAAHAAEAWGRINRACGVAVVTAGPGVTGVVTAVANSFSAQTPLVVIGGARPLVQAGQGALQELDQRAILAPITKWSAVCAAAGSHRRSCRDGVPARAGAAARARLPRAAHGRALRGRRRAFPSRSRSDARAFGDPREVMKAADLLTKAERPAVIAGTGIWWDGAWKQLRAFAENGRLPDLPQRFRSRCAAARPPALLPACPWSRARRGRRDLRHRDAARLPAQVRTVSGGDEARPHPRRRDGARPEPRTRRRDRRRLRRSARHPRRRRQTGRRTRRVARRLAAKRTRPGGTSIAPRSSPTPRPSTITAWEPSSTASWTRTRS